MKKFFQKDSCNLNNMLKVKKRPILIEAKQIFEKFEVETMEGIMKGKNGDFLMKGIDGELYVCDKEIFNKTYVIFKDF